MTEPSNDGLVHDADRLADRAAIEDLAAAYAHAVDDRDWPRWRALFTDDAYIDYRSAGGIDGDADTLTAWMPDAMASFDWCLHSMSTHEIVFEGADTAHGRLHVFNRNGLTWEGEAEIFDVGAVYEDTYRRVGDRWRFASRIEHTKYVLGGRFAEMIRSMTGG